MPKKNGEPEEPDRPGAGGTSAGEEDESLPSQAGIELEEEAQGQGMSSATKKDQQPPKKRARKTASSGGGAEVAGGGDSDDKKAERRAANRKSAFQSRQRRKILIEDLQKTVSELSKDNDGLRRQVANLKAKLELATIENQQLRNAAAGSALGGTNSTPAPRDLSALLQNQQSPLYGVSGGLSGTSGLAPSGVAGTPSGLLSGVINPTQGLNFERIMLERQLAHMLNQGQTNNNNFALAGLAAAGGALRPGGVQLQHPRQTSVATSTSAATTSDHSSQRPASPGPTPQEEPQQTLEDRNEALQRYFGESAALLRGGTTGSLTNYQALFPQQHAPVPAGGGGQTNLAALERFLEARRVEAGVSNCDGGGGAMGRNQDHPGADSAAGNN